MHGVVMKLRFLLLLRTSPYLFVAQTNVVVNVTIQVELKFSTPFFKIKLVSDLGVNGWLLLLVILPLIIDPP